jgi:hypothetical protein
MRRLTAVLTACLLPSASLAQQQERFDYWGPQRIMIQRGQQAIFTCNGLFTSHRTLEQIYAQELKLVDGVVGHGQGRRLRRRSGPEGGRDRIALGRCADDARGVP